MTTQFADLPKAERQQHFIERSHIIGLTIVGVRYSEEGVEDLTGWDHQGPILDLSDGSEMHFLHDDEGSGPGSGVIYRGEDEEGELIFSRLPTF